MARKPTQTETLPTTSTDAPSTPEDASSEDELTLDEIYARREASLTPSQKKEREERLKKRRELISKGILGYTAYAGPEKKPSRVVIRDDLRGADLESVLGHEVGHVIDQYAGEIPVPKDVRPELDELFNTLNNPNRDDLNPGYADIWSKPVTPRDQGYAPEDVERELMAEAIRGYLVNPSYVKEAAPNVAKHIRKWVNEHPELRKIIQFNALPAAILLGTQSDQAPEE